MIHGISGGFRQPGVADRGTAIAMPPCFYGAHRRGRGFTEVVSKQSADGVPPDRNRHRTHRTRASKERIGAVDELAGHRRRRPAALR
jgi:hypothetical protein